MKAKETTQTLLEERVQSEKDAFQKNIERVRALLKKNKALDLEDMILGNLEDFNVITSLPGSLNGRS
jgi:hypothetical protein